MAKDKIEGEGSYTATHNYDEKLEKFVHDKKAEIPKMAEDAEKAIEGPEGDALRRAEETGRSRAKH